MRPFSGHLVQYPRRYPTSKVTQTLNRRFRPTSCPDLLPLPGAIIRLTSIRSHGTGPQWSSGLAWQARKAGWQAGRGPYTAGLGVHRVKAHSKNGQNQLQETQNPLLSAGDNKVDDDCKGVRGCMHGLRSFSTATARSMDGEHALAYSLESRAYRLLTASSRFHCRLMLVPQSSITSKAVCGRLPVHLSVQSLNNGVNTIYRGHDPPSSPTCACMSVCMYYECMYYECRYVLIYV